MHGFDFSVPLFHTHVQGMCIVVTPKLVSDVLCVHRVEFLDYPSYEHLRILSKDELKSAFCERLSDWGVSVSSLTVQTLQKVLGFLT